MAESNVEELRDGLEAWRIVLYLVNQAVAAAEEGEPDVVLSDLDDILFIVGFTIEYLEKRRKALTDAKK